MIGFIGAGLFSGLNILRAFAVFFVIVAHLGVWFDDTSDSGRFIKNVAFPDGGFGVHLFFVLSGFLITSILLKAKNDNPASDKFVIIKNFFIRRALRIFPIYYLLLAVLFMLDCPDIRKYFWYFATYTSNILSYRTNGWNNFSHTWTLAVEEQFYLIWPWLIILVNNKYTKYVLFGGILTGIVTTYIAMQVQGHMGPLLVFNNFDAFGIGGLYAWARMNDERCKKFELAINILVGPAFIVFLYWKLRAFYSLPYYGWYMIKEVNCTIAMWIIILVVKNKSARMEKYFLGNGFLNYIGKISYGIYLYHYPYIAFFLGPVNNFLNSITSSYPALNKAVMDHHLNYWIHVCIVILVSAISFELIEKPLLNLKNLFNYSGKKRPVSAAVP